MSSDRLFRTRNGALVLQEDIAVAYFNERSADTAQFLQSSNLLRTLSRVDR